MAALAALCLALAPTAMAGPGKGKGGKPSSGSGTISPVFIDSTDGVAHYGQRVTFNVSTTATTEPWVHLECYQGGALVAQGWEGFFQRSLDDGVFGLASGAWTGGAADCTANLTKPDGSVLGSTSFHVYE
ncbi:MAG TPA: hypothetical protein VFB44_00105 [Thermoleophilaceae bacterium]|nr:hypothetical protein [Thermoleophilaceae bacterium]